MLKYFGCQQKKRQGVGLQSSSTARSELTQQLLHQGLNLDVTVGESLVVLARGYKLLLLAVWRGMISCGRVQARWPRVFGTSLFVVVRLQV